MADGSNRTSSAGIDNARATLADQGYVLTSDQAFGLPTNLRPGLLGEFFHGPDRVLRHDDGDWPADRLRARDVVQYQCRDDHLDLRECETITLTDRAASP